MAVIPLTADELLDFRADLGDEQRSERPPAFSDTALQRLYVRAEGNFDAAILLAFDQLLSNAARFTDYTQGETQEKKSQMFAQLIKRRELQAQKVEQAVNSAVAAKKSQVRILPYREVPVDRENKPGGF